MLCVILSSSHTPCVGSLFSRYPSRPACSPSCPYSHTLHDLVVFPHALRALRYARQTSLMCGCLPSCPVQPSVCAAVFRSARHGMRGGLPFCSVQHAWRFSFPPGAACAVVFRFTRCSIRGDLPFCLARPSMRRGVPFCLARHGVPGSVLFCPARPGVHSGVAGSS